MRTAVDKINSVLKFEFKKMFKQFMTKRDQKLELVSIDRDWVPETKDFNWAVAEV